MEKVAGVVSTEWVGLRVSAQVLDMRRIATKPKRFGERDSLESVRQREGFCVSVSIERVGKLVEWEK